MLAKRAAGILAGLALVVVLFGSVFVISGVFQETSGQTGKGGPAPWARPDAPDVRPAPLDGQ